jgi:hypothetical protein
MLVKSEYKSFTNMPHLPMKRDPFPEILPYRMISGKFLSLQNAMSATIEFTIKGRTDN